MKRIILIFITLCLIFSSCKGTTTVKEKKLEIITSFYPIYVTTINITKDISDVNVTNLTAPQVGCLHDYALLPENLKALEKADIFVMNGGNMESFFEDVSARLPKLKTVNSSEGITLIKGENGEENPHIWVSISSYILQVENIENKLSVLDPKNKDKYEKNKQDYINKLNELKASMHRDLDNLRNKDIITFHEAFPYFAKEFNLNIVSVIEREPGSEPTALELEKTIKIIKQKSIKAVFTEPQYSTKSADVIKAETGIKLFSLDPFVTGVASEQAMDDYLKIMEKNKNTLLEALS